MAAAYVASNRALFFSASGLVETITLTPGAAHHLLMLGIAWSAGSGAAIVSVADGVNTWVQIDAASDSTTGGMATYYVKDCAAGAITVTITWGADPGFGLIDLVEASGADLSAPLDQHNIRSAANPGTGTDAYHSTAVTTLAGGEFCWGFCFDEGASGKTWAKGTGWTAVVQPPTVVAADGASEYLVQSVQGALTATFTISGNSFSRAMVAIATFEAAGGGAAVPVISPAITGRPFPYAPGAVAHR